MLYSMLAEESMKNELQQELQNYLQELAELTGEPVKDARDYKYFDPYWEELDKRFPLVFFIDGQFAGFCFLRMNDIESRLEIAEFVIKPEYRLKGYGAEAVEKVKAFSLSVEQNPVIAAKTFKSHPYAADFWKKQGFEYKDSEGDQEIYLYGEK